MRDFLKNFFVDWHVKLVSLLLAIALWYYVVSTTMGERVLRVKLEYVNIPKMVEIKRDSKKSVYVRFRGPISDLQKISSKNIRVVVDLSSARPGTEGFFPVKLYLKDIPDRVRIIEPPPKTIWLSFYKVLKKRVRIIPKIKGKPAKNYVLVNVILKPRFALIKGTEPKIKKINLLETYPIVVEGRKKSFKKRVKLNKRNIVSLGLILVDPKDGMVDVRCEIVSAINIVEVSIPVRVIHLNPNLYVKSIKPKFVKVKIRKKFGVKFSINDIKARIMGDIYSRPQRDRAVVEISTTNKDIELLTKVAYVDIEIDKKNKKIREQ